ncbi:hypothetical protein D3C81_2175950 [compost metagenome]
MTCNLAILAAPGFEGLDGKLGSTVPAREGAAMIAVAMALHITQPEVEMLGKARQQGLVHQAAKAVAV